MSDSKLAYEHHSNKKIILTLASEIQPEPINWIWKDWLAKGKLTILAGAGGAGKTTISLNIASAISTGGIFPDGSQSQQGSVLIWSGEDDSSDVLVPRLIAAKASLEKISFITGTHSLHGNRNFNPQTDIAELKSAMRDIGDISLLIIDPLVSFVDGNMNLANVVRQSLQPLLDLAQDSGCAIIGITHFGKGGQGKDVAERVIGSQAFSAIARMVWVAATNKISGDGVLVRAKSNLGSTEGGYLYQVEEKKIDIKDIYSTHISWMGYKTGSAQEIVDEIDPSLDSQNGGGQLRDCVTWMTELLANNGGSGIKKEILALGISNGYSVSTIQRARAQLNLDISQSGFGKEKISLWSLPSDNHFKGEHSSQISNLTRMSHLDTNVDLASSGLQYEIN